MTRSVWLKADDEVGDWEERKRRITAGLEAGVDWVLVDERDVGRVRELGSINVAALVGEDVHVMEAEADGPEPDATVVGKDAEGDGTVDLPPDLAGSADLSALRRGDGDVDGGYVRILGPAYETFAEEVAREAAYTARRSRWSTPTAAPGPQSSAAQRSNTGRCSGSRQRPKTATASRRSYRTPKRSRSRPGRAAGPSLTSNRATNYTPTPATFIGLRASVRTK